jgi:hypothetical protein
MAKWCNDCVLSKRLKDRYISCGGYCPIFGKDFEELAEFVVNKLSDDEVDKIESEYQERYK